MSTDTGPMPQINGITQETYVRAWVEALESGNYTQCRHRLHGELDYCCLGIACLVGEQLGIAGSNVRRQKNNEDPDEWFYTLIGQDKKDDATFNGNKAVEMNDDMRMTFPEIAEEIRAHYPQYFGCATASE